MTILRMRYDATSADTVLLAAEVHPDYKKTKKRLFVGYFFADSVRI
jgi:hypothetical protein